MPSYDYQCQDCGHRFEEFQSMSDPVLTDCPACGKPALKRLIAGGLGVIFKGSGFYVTDSKKSPGAKKTASGSAAASKPETESTSSAPEKKEAAKVPT